MKESTLDFERMALGIELGSTRIKAVLIGADHIPIASGEYNWENRLEEGFWTYHLEDVWKGLQSVYREIAEEVKKTFDQSLTHVGSVGISAMMHGYLPFDATGQQLVSFRTWRNTTTEHAAQKLTSLFQFTIPQRWSIAHLYQATLNEEDHVQEISFLTTLAGYVHWKLTDTKVLGIGEASGMFPIDTKQCDYDKDLMELYDNLTTKYEYDWTLKDILPKVKNAGDFAGTLTEEGAKLLDPSGVLQAGVPFCPPEGDAGTGMVATNSVAENTGNISAGTSIFAMIILEQDLINYYPEINVVTTPTGKPVAMVHCNNFTSDINAWANLFKQFSEAMGNPVDEHELFTVLFNQAMKADDDVGGLAGCNYYSGEPITQFEEGRPLFVRMPDSRFTLPNFMKMHIYSALATLKIGMDILIKEENIEVDQILGHGGFFKTEKVGQQLLADAIEVPVSVMEQASEGGAWGMALLASYYIQKNENQTLNKYLEKVFSNQKLNRTIPIERGVKSFRNYLKRFKDVLIIERSATDVLR